MAKIKTMEEYVFDKHISWNPAGQRLGYEEATKVMFPKLLPKLLIICPPI